MPSSATKVIIIEETSNAAPVTGAGTGDLISLQSSVTKQVTIEFSPDTSLLDAGKLFGYALARMRSS